MYRLSKRKVKALNGYRSFFEKEVAELLGDTVEYEPDRIPFTQPAKKRTYCPDFKLREGVYIECKGLFTSEDRSKLIWFKEQHPEITVYLLFQNAKVKLRKGSTTTYGDWADKNGFEWHDFKDGTIPRGWYSDKQDSSNTRHTSKTRRQPRLSGVDRKVHS